MYAKFEELPKGIQNLVKWDLRLYDSCTVYFENGEYHVTTSVCIKSHYAEDYKVVGVYYAKDLFTVEERIIIYVEEFHSYPIEYKGKKDYKMLKSLTYGDKVVFDDNGNIVKL